MEKYLSFELREAVTDSKDVVLIPQAPVRAALYREWGKTKPG
jgi:hypothetical protein